MGSGPIQLGQQSLSANTSIQIELHFYPRSQDLKPLIYSSFTCFITSKPNDCSARVKWPSIWQFLHRIKNLSIRNYHSLINFLALSTWICLFLSYLCMYWFNHYNHKNLSSLIKWSFLKEMSIHMFQLNEHKVIVSDLYWVAMQCTEHDFLNFSFVLKHKAT